MNIKRYKSMEHGGLVEDPDGLLVQWSDLIAAGALIPVPCGEACFPGQALEQFCLLEDKLCLFLNRLGVVVFRVVETGQNIHISAYTIVQPVRLVRLEDAQ